MSFVIYRIRVEDRQSPEFLLFETGRFHRPLAIFSKIELRCMAYRYAQECPEDMAAILEEVKQTQGASNG